eukprot:1330792-Prymnesium_polylepis.1
MGMTAPAATAPASRTLRMRLRALQDAEAASSVQAPHVPPPVLRGGRRGEHEAQQRERSVRSA